jgi:non-homologous end joining protein Ku
MWTGTIELGLVNIPVTLAKAVDDKSESAIKQVCRCHSLPIDARWRCKETHELCTDTVPAIKIGEGDNDWLEIDESEMVAIEDRTKSKILTLLDVQPVDTLPLMFAYGVYYVRHNAKANVEPTAMATLVAALSKSNYGLMVNWGSAANEKLAAITAEAGVLVLRLVPHWDRVRVASSMERAHFKGKLDKRNVERMTELLEAFRNPEGFQYPKYADEGQELRHALIERILNGEQMPEQAPAPKVDPDQFFEMLDKAIEEVRS